MNRAGAFLVSSAFALFINGCATDAVTTTTGDVVGTEWSGVSKFLGIPYAAPPSGERRFRPPSPREPWSEPLDASKFGPSCPQPDTGLSSSPQDEDCLHLNVWTPNLKADARLPVMVFIHGGSFVAGSGDFDGSYLAQKGPVVVVTINYRLGPFGFLAHPALIAEDPDKSAGNYGLLDQQLALGWVRSNIEAFGGDPENVTVFGESAGAGSVCAHMASPLAEGLFQRAIGESGFCLLSTMPLLDDPSQTHESAVSLGQRAAAALGCDTEPDVAACLRKKPVKDVLDAVPFELNFDLHAASYGPNLDGHVLPADMRGAFKNADFARVPFLSGVNKDEGTLFARLSKVKTRAEFEDVVTTSIAAHADEALALYPESTYPDANDALSALLGDIFVCGQRLQARLVAAAVPQTFLYHFTRVSLAGQLTDLGAVHGTEIPYVFHSFFPPFIGGPEDEKVSDQVIGYWTRFAKTGDPNGGEAVAWPAVTDKNEYLQIDTTSKAGTELRAEICDVMEPWLLEL